MRKFTNIMKHALGMIPTVTHPRSTFDRTSRFMTTADAGYLFPIYCQEIYPGDDVNIITHMSARLNTPIVPFMNNVCIDKHWFFVPTRLVWSNFQRFMGEKENPDDTNDYLVPQITIPSGGFPVHSLGDYFGLPTFACGTANKINALPFRCYNLIYNEWFRHEKLIDSLTVNKEDTGDDTLLASGGYAVRRRTKRRDYFTSCLPSPQEGQAVDVPLGNSAPVTMIDDYSTKTQKVRVANGTIITTSQGLGGQAITGNVMNDTQAVNLFLDPNGTMQADLSEATAATINQWREAFALQRIAEKLARGGNRYTEILRYLWGVISPDARLQRPEFLGSETDYIQIHQVAQTSSTDSTSPQGNISAMSFGLYHGQRRIKRSFTEHGYLMCLASIRSDLMYQQGIDRQWTRSTVHDFYNPAFAHLGEQAVLNKEIYTDGTSADNDVFGYMPRFDELRFGKSLITGKLRSTDSTPLDFWHLAQKFETRPCLNQTFIEENPPIDRVIAVQDEPQFTLDFAFDAKYTRVMPVYSDPGFIDHF